MILRLLACPLLALGALASRPARANFATAVVRLEGGEPVRLLWDDEAGGAREVAWFDGEGQACAAVMDVDDLGQRAFLAVRVRCYDERGRAIVKFEPQIHMAWGEDASIRSGGSGEPSSLVIDIATVSEGRPADGPLVIRRTFFAEEGRSTYRWHSPRAEASGLDCAEGVAPIALDGWLGGEVRGRYRRGDRLEVPCTMTTSGAAEVPVQLSLWFL